MKKELEVAISGARAAGAVLREMLFTASVKEKAPKDLVTDADLAAQKVLETTILGAFPSHRFLGEESGADIKRFQDGSEWTWVVDPLDGTTNYVHRFPNFAVSIGLVKEGSTRLGVVFDPMADELYTSVKDEGAFLNGTKIGVSKCCRLDEAMVAASFPPDVHRGSKEVHQFLNVLELCQSIRRLGSAALNLCYVAQGRLDAYWANRLKPWDVAAGLLIASEAGAIATGLSGSPIDVWNGEVLIAATPPLHVAMCAAIHKG